jgi:hypothetical protein
VRNFTLADMRQTLPSPLLHLFAVLLAVLLARPVQAQTPPATAPDWEQVAAEMIQRPEFEALPLQIRPPRGQSLGGSPIEMQFQAGQCLLNLRTRGNPAAERLLAQALPEDRTLWMQAVLAHEIAHCWRWQQGNDPGLQQLATLMGTASADAGAARQVQRQLGLEESFADVAALAWVATVAPQRFDAVLKAFQRLRGDLRLSSGPHDTRAALARVQREGFALGRPVFLAASELLQQAP